MQILYRQCTNHHLEYLRRYFSSLLKWKNDDEYVKKERHHDGKLSVMDILPNEDTYIY